MATLRVVSRYRNVGLRLDLEPGTVESFDDEMAAFLLRDSPGSFEAVPDGTKADEPPEEVPASELDEEPEPVDQGPEDDGLEQLTMTELRDRAAQAEIDLRGFRRKQDVIAAIRGA